VADVTNNAHCKAQSFKRRGLSIIPLLKWPHVSNDLGRLKADDVPHAINASICASVLLLGWTRLTATFALVARVEFHVNFFVLKTITPNRLKARQKMLRGGYAAVTRRAKIARRQIGSALAPRWLHSILNGWE
jgi:hypothetical protein